MGVCILGRLIQHTEVSARGRVFGPESPLPPVTPRLVDPALRNVRIVGYPARLLGAVPEQRQVGLRLVLCEAGFLEVGYDVLTHIKIRYPDIGRNTGA